MPPPRLSHDALRPAHQQRDPRTRTEAAIEVQSTNSEEPEAEESGRSEDETERVMNHVEDLRSRHRPLTTIDWRGEVCQFLNVSVDTPNKDVILALHDAADKLQELERLQALALQTQGPPKYEVIHSILCHASGKGPVLYSHEPFVGEAGPLNAHLYGRSSIRNVELFVEKSKAVFVACKEYDCCGPAMQKPREHDADDNIEPKASSHLVRERVMFVSPDLRAALQQIAAVALKGTSHPKFEAQQYGFEDLQYPYLWWYHRRQKIESASRHLPRNMQIHLDVFKGYIRDNVVKDWTIADDLMRNGLMSPKYIDYMIDVGDVVILSLKGSLDADIEAYVAMDRLKLQKRQSRNAQGFLDVASWAFDGTFRRVSSRLPFIIPPQESDEFAITDLPIYPVKFSNPATVAALRRRGRMFWKCRYMNYVSYQRTSNAAVGSSDESRFMVDTMMYKRIHRDKKSATEPESRDDLGPVKMAQDDPKLGDEFILCLPSTITGFNMQSKEWVTLKVALMTDVEWNHEAFEHLVIENETKELVQAVVTNQIRAEQGTDVIQTKGNGLFILLHGHVLLVMGDGIRESLRLTDHSGPGTGKTLTAESVAEVAQKPLYRVTCGDIGTQAEAVEKYLETVLLLGRKWGCVVLLDEADVFLEQRSLLNLERNALVSVFLRVLEYYDGILILTSNRVGIFDEAFKSRIQLNLRYKNLEYAQRIKIWSNFITRLEALCKGIDASRKDGQIEEGAGIDAEEIRGKLETLAVTQLNGREIRNAISTARQLAMYRKEPLRYKHLRTVIDKVETFDKYLKDLKGGLTGDEIQKDKMER